MIRLRASNSSLIDSSNAILAERTITGVIEPSCITGIKDLPRNINKTKLAPNPKSARFTTSRGFFKLQSSMKS